MRKMSAELDSALSATGSIWSYVKVVVFHSTALFSLPCDDVNGVKTDREKLFLHVDL